MRWQAHGRWVDRLRRRTCRGTADAVGGAGEHARPRDDAVATAADSRLPPGAPRPAPCAAVVRCRRSNPDSGGPSGRAHRLLGQRGMCHRVLFSLLPFRSALLRHLPSRLLPLSVLRRPPRLFFLVRFFPFSFSLPFLCFLLPLLLFLFFTLFFSILYFS